MTTHWPTDPDAGVHLGGVAECAECAQNGPETGLGAPNGVPGVSLDPQEDE